MPPVWADEPWRGRLEAARIEVPEGCYRAREKRWKGEEKNSAEEAERDENGRSSGDTDGEREGEKQRARETKS